MYEGEKARLRRRVAGVLLASPRSVAPLLPRASVSLLATLFDPLIQRLQNPSVHRRDHIHRRIQFFFGHSRLPCVRKAPLDSRIAKPHHGDRETDQHLLPLGETFHRMGVAIKGSKVSFLQRRCSCS